MTKTNNHAATAMYRNLGVGWASSTLAFISIAFIPIPFLLYTVSAFQIRQSWRGKETNHILVWRKASQTV